VVKLLTSQGSGAIADAQIIDIQVNNFRLYIDELLGEEGIHNGA